LLPAWFKAITKSNICFFVEESITDPKNQRLILRARNLSFSKIMLLDEKCVYTPAPNDPTSTKFLQEFFALSHIRGLRRRMEKFCVERYFHNSHVGREIMQETLEKIKDKELQ